MDVRSIRTQSTLWLHVLRTVRHRSGIKDPCLRNQQRAFESLPELTAETSQTETLEHEEVDA